MSVQFIVSFRDDDNNQDDSSRLLLYHELTEKMLSNNEKEQKIGIIKGMWRFAKEFNNSGSSYCHFDLEAYSMVVLETEPSYYLAIGFDKIYKDQWRKYRVRLNQSYQQFVMKNGRMRDIVDKRLTQLMNEHYIPFWDEINLVSDYFLVQDINTAIDDTMFPCCQFADALNSVSEVKEWQTYIKNNILLSKENYLNVKDVCIYHFPKNNECPMKYGFVGNFDSQFKSLPILSNWLVGIDSMYGTISSHGLAGTMSLAKAGQQIEIDTATSEREDNTNLKSVWDNVTLPISFTMDALKDLGHLTGVANSLSLFTSLKPTWNPWSSSSNETGANKSKGNKSDEYSWLISPLSPSFLPKVYQIRQLHLQFDSWKRYNVIFWKFKDILVAVIVQPEFDKIFEESYLMSLQEDLWNGITLFYENPGFEERSCSFDYTLFYKEDNKFYSSIPIWKNSLDEDETALKLVIKGLDETFQFLTNSTNRNSAVATATEIGHDMSLTERSIPIGNAEKHIGTEKKDMSIFDSLSESQMFELNKELTAILETRNLTASYKEAGSKERLLKLNNGLMVYLLETNSKMLLIIKNWFTDRKRKLVSKNNSGMIESLGPDVSRWWSRIENHEPL